MFFSCALKPVIHVLTFLNNGLLSHCPVVACPYPDSLCCSMLRHFSDKIDEYYSQEDIIILDRRNGGYYLDLLASHNLCLVTGGAQVIGNEFCHAFV